MQKIFGINKKPSSIPEISSVKSQSVTEASASCDEEPLVWSPEKLASEAVTDSPEYCLYMSESYDRLKHVLTIIENVNKVRQRMGQLLSDLVGTNHNLLCELRELEKFVNPDAQTLLNNSIETFDSIKNGFEVLSEALNHTEIISDRAEIKKQIQACQTDLKNHTSKVYRRISRKMLKSTKGNPSTLIDAEVGIDGEDKAADSEDFRKKLIEKNLGLAAQEFQIDAFLNEDLILGISALKNPFSVFFKMGSFNLDTSSKEDSSKLMEKIRESRSAKKKAFEGFATVFTENYLTKKNRNLRNNCTFEGIAVHHQKIFSKRVFLQYNSFNNILTRTNMENFKDVTENLVSKVDRLFNDNIEVINGFDVITNKENILTFTVFDEEERDRWLSSFGKNLTIPTISLSAKPTFEYNERFLILSLMCVESCASTVEGIYRISTTMHEINKIMSRISTMEGNVFVVDKLSAHSYTGCVKKWLEILQFIISTDQYATYFLPLETKEEDNLCENLKQPFTDVINELIPEKRQALLLLCRHLRRLSKDEKSNKMSIRNLAACLMPRIFQFDQEKMFKNFHFMITLCCYLISNFESIFNCDPEKPYDENFTFLTRENFMTLADTENMVENYEKVTLLCDISLDEDLEQSLTAASPDEEGSGGDAVAESKLAGTNKILLPSGKIKKFYTSMIMKSKSISIDSQKN